MQFAFSRGTMLTYLVSSFFPHHMMLGGMMILRSSFGHLVYQLRLSMNERVCHFSASKKEGVLLCDLWTHLWRLSLMLIMSIPTQNVFVFLCISFWFPVLSYLLETWMSIYHGNSTWFLIVQVVQFIDRSLRKLRVAGLTCSTMQCGCTACSTSLIVQRCNGYA